MKVKHFADSGEEYKSEQEFLDDITRVKGSATRRQQADSEVSAEVVPT